MKGHKGKFYASVEFVKGEFFPEVLWKLKFIPLRVTFSYEKHAFEYVGYSPIFDVIREGQRIPEYKIEVSTTGGKLAKVSAVKVIL